jgi:hypothetical protein
MKKLFTLTIFLLASLAAFAQPYGFEWIDFSARHFKFSVATRSIHRIPTSTLQSAGISQGEIIGDRMRLYRDGKEVAIFTTTSGVFGEDDFIEFFADGNNGTLETELYLSPEQQPNGRYSLFTDTATYYLAVGQASGGLRLENVPNDLSNLPPREEFYYHKSRQQNTNFFVRGENPAQTLNFIFNSNFDIGEGFGWQQITGPSGARQINVANQFRYTAVDLPARVRGQMVFINNSTLHKSTISYGGIERQVLEGNRAGLREIDFTLLTSELGAGSTPFRYTAEIPNERLTVYWVEIEYPRLFNFANLSRFDFGVNKTANSYLEIGNFNRRTTTPIVYDLKNNRRYIPTVDGTVLKLHLKASDSPQDSLFISSQAPEDIVAVSQLTSVSFKDFRSQENQGDYIIISHKSLINSSGGTDYIKAYVDYRSSPTGGNYTVAVYYIDELEDLFSWGVRTNPLAIRNFINYAVDSFAIKPDQVFIIGKGLEYNSIRNNPDRFSRCLVQTYGEPGSDMLLTSRNVFDPTPQVSIGRLSAQNGDQVKDYLKKVMDYDMNLRSDNPLNQTLEQKEWMKNVLHLGGGNFLDEQVTFARYLENYKRVIEGPFYGGQVRSYYKNTSDPVQVAQSTALDSLITNGLSLITFFGHSSTSSVDFDLEPEGFKNSGGRYPLILTNGCYVGNIFADINTYSERFVLTPDRCAIGYIGPMTLAVAFSLNQYGTNFYNKISVTDYGEPIGTILRKTAADVFSSALVTDRVLGQQMIYHGDPGVRVNGFPRPDYVITEQSILFNPATVNASVDSFQLKVIVKNLGRSINEDYTVTVDRQLPGGELETYERRLKTPSFVDTVIFDIRTNNITGLGENIFKIKVDAAEEIDELSELNNEVTIIRFFITDDVIPIYPPKFGIVNNSNITLSYSTANPLLETRQYVLQIDTTEFFNSPLLTTTKITQSGGVLNWNNPSISFLPGKVYYWRGSLDTLYGNPLSWNNSSFLYDPALSPGWNQSHYFQYLNNAFNTMQLPDNRRFQFVDNIRSIKVVNGTDALGVNARSLFFDNNLIARNAFDRRGFLFFVLDTKTGQPLSTYQVGSTGYGEYGNVIRTLLVDVKIIEYNTTFQRDRYSCYLFMKSIIPDQAIVCGYSFGNAEYTKWALDDSSAFNGETLFDAFEQLGVTQIRNIEENNPFVFFTQKGNPFFPTEQIEVERDQIIDTTFTFTGTWNAGSFLSPLIGPSTGWNTADRLFTSLETPSTDSVVFNLYGYSESGIRAKLLGNFNRNVDISNIDPVEFPFLQLEMEASDRLNSTAPQVQHWRIIHEEVPEAAINPQIFLTKGPDTIPLGQTYKCAVAFENITNKDMDSVLVKFVVKDASNRQEVSFKRFARLPGKQHIVIDFEYPFVNSTNQGLNTITFEANPDRDQRELWLFNNVAVFNVFVLQDNLNPLMDVTFDGRHITDGEIVSPTPEVLIRLKDENKFLALNDTMAFKVFLRAPGSTVPVQLDPRSTEFTFLPADPLKLDESNEARLFYRPELPEDGIYELRVQAADRSRNDAGTNEYRVRFLIDRKPAISNILNYPNPFSTQTQFVFTVTGSEVPQDLKIQIMTVTGKVVKEITKEQLGDIRIGTNITDYRWDGTDNFGDRLANGLYLYRVVARLNGKPLDLLEGSADKFFKKGFGKMYLVR